MPIAHKLTEATMIPPGTTLVTGENIVYLMGLSFIIGSLLTIFVLILLDFMRRDKIAS